MLKDYQTKGVSWMLMREQDPDHPGGVQSDEVGLGKTIMMIETMNRNPLSKTLLIVPKSLLPQWKIELSKWYKYKASTKIEEDTSCVCATLSSFYKDRTIYHEFQWDRIIIDEAHSIKNKRSKTHKSVCKLTGRIKWALTATPVMNKMVDLWGILKWIGEDIEEVYTNTELVNKYFLRRTQDFLDLPGYTVTTLYGTFSEKERSLYNDIVEYIRALHPNQQICKLEELMRMIQICVHPQLFYNGIGNKFQFCPQKWEGQSTKLNMLSMLLVNKEKTLIFCKFTNEIKAYYNLFPGSLILYGAMTLEQREETLRKYKESDVPFLFVQEKIGSCGLNLQVANRVIFTSPNWCPTIEHQAIGRSHRTGQSNHVFVYKLVIDNSIETKILERQKSKESAIVENLWKYYTQKN